MFIVLGSFLSNILLANSSKTSRKIKTVRGFYSVSLLHTIDQCRLYYPSQHLSLCCTNNLENRHTMVLAPVTYTLFIFQFYIHTTIKSYKSSLPVFKSADVIEPVAQMLIPLWAYQSLSAM